MKLYTAIIGGGLILVAMLNMLLGVFAPLQTLLWVVVLAISCGLIDGVVTLAIHLMPQKLFDPNKSCYKVSSRQIARYSKWGVKRWKDYVPDLGQFCNFKKNKIEHPKDPKYLHKFLVENCYADVLHTVSAYFGFFMLLVCPDHAILSMGLPIAIINFVINMMPAIIQKYMRPRLLSLYNRLCAMQDKIEQKSPFCESEQIKSNNE